MKHLKKYNEGKLERKFTEDEIRMLTMEGMILNDAKDAELFSVISQKIVGIDREKNSNDVEYVIQDNSTGKYYTAELLDSRWYDQDRYNADKQWTEVKKNVKTIITFE